MSRGYTEEEVQIVANSLLGKTFKEISKNGTCYDKGSFGHIIEEDVYGYDINSFSEPDFLNAGVELKVTPYKVNRNGTLSAKERLVLNIINYMDEYKNDFYNSHFWFKNKKIQIVWYLYEEGKKKEDLMITHQLLFTFPEEDLKIIEHDWEIIINKIKRGEAHLLSEGDTMYLGACTKGANTNSLREQPFCNIMAKQRAFSLKTSYMTQLVRNYIGEAKDVEKFLTKDVSFEDYVNNVVNKYKGMSQHELMRIFGLDSTAKNVNGLIVSKMFNVSSLANTSEFLKANITPRTIRMEENGRIKESFPFKAFNFIKLANEDWEDSDFRNLLESYKYMFFVFKKEKDEYIFKGIKLWNMPYQNIEKEAKEVWLKTKIVLNSGNIVSYVDEKGKRSTNFPGMKDNKIFHVRPHGRDASDTLPLPVQDKLTNSNRYTKQCFWINASYLEDILKDDFNSNDDSSSNSDSCVNYLNNQSLSSDNDCERISEPSIKYVASNPELLCDYNLFELVNYGINMVNISKIVDKRISPYDIFFNSIKALDNVDIPSITKTKVVSAVIEMFGNEDTNRNIRELNYQGFSSQKCKEFEDELFTIEKLYNMTEEECVKYNIKDKFHKKIVNAIINNSEVIRESNANTTSSFLLENELKKYKEDKPVNRIILQKIMERKVGYNINNFSEDYNKLYSSGKIKVNNFGVYYVKESILDFIEKNYLDKEKEILVKRLYGLTLEEIGNKFGVTRERVRQICKKEFSRIIKNEFYEDQFKNIFAKYFWEKEMFCKILNLEGYVFEYLNMKYKVGSADINDILFDDTISESAKNEYKKIKQISVNDNGNIITDVNDIIMDYLKANPDKQYTVPQLLKMYNSEKSKYKELDLPELTNRTLDARLGRMEKVITGFHQTARYYDFDKLSIDSINTLKDFLNLDDGVYSTDYIFKNNKSFMNDINILDCYELHNLYKTRLNIENDNFQILRMPNFIIGYKEKEDFFMEKIKELAPISMDEFADILTEDYGHYKPTIISYLGQVFTQYINSDGFIETESYLLCDDVKVKLKRLLVDDIYSLQYAKDIFEELGVDISKNVLTRVNFDSIGYCLRNGYIIKKEYSSINKYLDMKSQCNDIIRIDPDLLRCNALYVFFNEYCQEYKIFKVNKGLYIPYVKMVEKGITMDYINRIFKDMKNAFSEENYFSVENVKNEIDISALSDFGFDDEFIENIIFYNKDISTLRINNNRLFSFIKKKLCIEKFIEDEMEKYRSISISDLVDAIRDTYCIDMSYDVVKGYTYKLSNIYYSSNLDKLYVDKDDFYKEIYDE